MIYIRKNGVYYENNYSPDANEYVFTKVDSFVPYLNEVIHIDSEVTLECLFDLLERDEDIINIIFGSHMGHHPIRPFIDEIKSKCIPESQEEMEYIDCCWVSEQFDYKRFYERFKDEKRSEQDEELFGELEEPSDDESNEINIYVDIHGVGPYQPFEGEEDHYKEGYVPPETSTYAIEFTPLYRLKHLPIKLNTSFVMKEEHYDNKEHVVASGDMEFTVFEVFGAILSEITFSGLPEERDEKWKDVTDSIDEYKKEFDEDEEREE